MEETSLWPDFGEESIELPKKILDDQARIFNSRWQGIFECTITTREKLVDMWTPVGLGEDSEMKEIPQQILMHIVAPRVGGYRFAVLMVTFLVSKVYPCTVENCLDRPSLPQKPQNPEDFKAVIKNILHSERLKNAISVLRSQSE